MGSNKLGKEPYEWSQINRVQRADTMPAPIKKVTSTD